MSLIEELMLDGLRDGAKAHRINLYDETMSSSFRGSFHNCLWCWQYGDDYDEDDCNEYGDENGLMVSVMSHARVSSYAIDIVLAGSLASLAIECDGHDFHERTKQQAAYDRSRDRELLAMCLPTIRFTGSEIVHSVERCVEDASKIVRLLNIRERLLIKAMDGDIACEINTIAGVR